MVESDCLVLSKQDEGLTIVETSRREFPELTGLESSIEERVGDALGPMQCHVQVGSESEQIVHEIEDTPEPELPRVEGISTGLFVSWNIAGLKSRMKIPEWASFILDHAVCLFQETWLLEPLFFEGYVNFSIPATKGIRGRPSGGLAIWVRQALGLRVSILPTGCSDIQLVRFDLGVQGNLDLYNVYIRGIRGGNQTHY